jgi:hypothetical protein
MFRGIDHLVIACPDPDAAAAELETRLGLLATGGGRHEGRGSHNRLVFLADGSYLELIGVTDAGVASTSPVGAATVRALGHGGGLATFALAVDDLEAAVATLAAAGSHLGPATHGDRRRDDGELVEWWTAIPDQPLGPTMPFLIEHAYTGVEWGPQALADRARFVHPIGSPVSLVSLELSVADAPAVAEDLRRQLGIDFDGTDAAIGPHRLRLVEGGLTATVALVAEGAEPREADLGGIRFAVTSGRG